MNRKDKYRRDNRDATIFRRDIAQRTMIEREIIERWTGKVLDGIPYKDYGCGNDGEYLEISKVNTNADYEVDGIGLVEVKFSIPFLTKVFHLKVANVNSCIKQNASILFVNGWSEDEPLFILISPEQLRQIKDWCEKIAWQGFGNKLSYRIPVDLFDVWKLFPK